MKKTLTLLLCLGLTSGAAVGAGDPVAGKAKAAACGGCHGMDGNSANPLWPSLAGQQDDYLRKQLADFKSDARQDPVMSAQAKGLDDQAIADIAAHFSSQAIKTGAAKKETLELGQQIYRGGIVASGVPACASCHGPSGGGNAGAKFPAIGGQHAAYAEKTLKDFRSGTRGNDANGMMRDIAAKMTDEQIAAVANYMSGLH